MAAILNVNSKAAVVHANKLEKLHKSALPLAIRGTLNTVAFNHKQRTLPKVAAHKFENRKKTFFTKFSKVEKATGFNLKSMHSTVGFTPTGDATSKQAVEDLEVQEKGGKIKGRSFIPMDTARTGNSKSKPVRKTDRISKIRYIRRIKKGGSKQRSRFIRFAYRGGVGTPLLYGNTLFIVKSLKGRNIKLKPLYSFKKGREVNVSSTGFMRKSSLLANKHVDHIFVKEAEFRIKKLMK